jgi:hypothetical protein
MNQVTKQKPAIPKDEQNAKVDPGQKPGAGAVTATAGSNVAVAQMDYEDYAGAGTENADKDSFAIPFLVVLQPMSPAVVEGTVPGAKAGMLMNSVTNELYESVYVVPCHFQRRYVRWAPREMGGGYKGEFNVAEVETGGMIEKGVVKKIDNRLYFPLEDGSVNEKKCDKLADTRNHFVLLLRSPEDIIGSPAVMAMASTQIKASKKLNALIQGQTLISKRNGAPFNPPAWAFKYKVGTTKKTNDKGTWFVVDVESAGETNPFVSKRGLDFYTQIKTGGVELATDSLGDHDAEDGGSTKEGF